jgi:PAS domain S-box-containing protein
MTFFTHQAKNISGRSFIAALVLMTWCMSANAAVAPTQKKANTIVAVFQCDYSPVSYWDKNTNKPSGFFVDIMNSIAGRSGLTVKYICKNDWPEMITAIESGEADVGILLKSHEREKTLLFSAPIGVTYLSFFARSQSSIDTNIVPAGYIVGVVKGSMSDEHLKTRLGLRLQTEGTYQEGIFRLLAGKIDLFAGEDAMILKSAREAGLDERIKKVGNPFLERERCLVVDKNNVHLHAQLNKALQGFVGGPEYRRIYLKWYGTPASYWTTRRILIASGVVLFLVLWGMALWRYLSLFRINKELMRNIAERKEAEKKLTAAVTVSQQETAKTEAVIAALGDGLVIIDREFQIVYQNEVSRKMIGNLTGQICYRAGDGRQTICENCPVERSFRDGQVHRIERTWTTGKTNLPVDITSSPLRDSSGEIIGVIEVVRDITERKRAEEVLSRSRNELEILVRERTAELTMMNDQLRNLSTHLQNAREDERTRIAREVHDDLGQSLTALKIDLSLLRKRLPPEQKAAIERAESMDVLVEATIQSVKRISMDLRPGILDHLGLTAAIEWQAEEFEKRTGIPCRVVFEPEEISLDKDRTTTVFRIFQEVLTNAARHADATKISVLLTEQADGLMLHVEDNGKGITEKELSDPNSLGLLGMRERVNTWGGSLSISGSRDKGTAVTVLIPRPPAL